MNLRRPLRAAVILGLAIGLAGCAAGEPTPAPGLQLNAADFERTGGCADAVIYAASADDTMLIAVEWPGVAGEAQSEGELTESVSLPTDQVSVKLQGGQRLSEGYCTDIIMLDAPIVATESMASAGDASISVTPSGADPIFPVSRATLILTDVVFTYESPHGQQVFRLDRLEVPDVQIGWMPG